MIYINNKQVLKEYNKDIKRESEVITEAARIINKMRNEINKVLIDITLEHSNNKLN